MKIVNFYQCGICKTIYPEKEMAERCEAQGKPEVKLLKDLAVWVINGEGKKEPGIVRQVGYVRTVGDGCPVDRLSEICWGKVCESIEPHEIKYFVEFVNRRGSFIWTDGKILEPR